MRKFVAALAALLPFSVMASGPPDVVSWVCSQPGHMGKEKAYAITHVFQAEEHNYEEKEWIFEEYVQEKTQGEFEPGVDSSCREFSTESKAEKYLEKMTSKAKKRNYSILWIDFGGLEE